MGVKAKGRRRARPPPLEIAPRRVPTQERGRQRVDLILDAAAQVFDDVGYDAATTNTIAERAGVPIGSVYQFFPNKSALFHALAARYRDEVRQLFEQKTGPATERLPLTELVHGTIDAIVHFHRTRPGFRTLIAVARTTPELVAGTAELLELFERRMAEHLAARVPGLPPHQRALTAAVLVRVADALMVLASRRHGTPDPEVIEEMKRVLDRYLAPVEATYGGRRKD